MSSKKSTRSASRQASSKKSSNLWPQAISDFSQQTGASASEASQALSRSWRASNVSSPEQVPEVVDEALRQKVRSVYSEDPVSPSSEASPAWRRATALLRGATGLSQRDAEQLLERIWVPGLDAHPEYAGQAASLARELLWLVLDVASAAEQEGREEQKGPITNEAEDHVPMARRPSMESQNSGYLSDADDTDSTTADESEEDTFYKTAGPSEF